MKKGITFFLVTAMILGVIAGLLLHAFVSDPDTLSGVLAVFGVVTDIFLRLIRMIIAPLVLSTLTLGIARMGGGKEIGRVGLKTILLFLAGTAAALAVAFTLMEGFRPGEGLHLTATAVAEPVVQANLTLQSFIARIFPTSLADAMARNEILQIVVFSVFAGMACAALPPEPRERLVGLLDAVAGVMFKLTLYVMWVAPMAVFSALASAVVAQGYGVISTYAAFIGEYYLGLGLLWALLIAAGRAVIGRRIGPLMKATREPALIAFSTSSSEAAYPQLLGNLEAFGVPNRIVSFVLPLGYAFNLTGSMLYATMATLFAAEAYDIAMSPGEKALTAFLLFIASKGIANVPRGALLVVAATLPYLHIPEAAVPFLLAVDHILDAGRSCTNIAANAIVTTIIARWEKQLGDGPAELAAVLAE